MPTEAKYSEMDFHVTALYESGRRINANMPVVGREWYLNANTGAATADGRAVSRSKLTMADIFDELSSGDVVYTVGKIREELTAPAGIFGVKIIGLSSQRHPDAHTSNNGYVGSAWTPPASPTAATPLCIVRQQGWEFYNMLFDCPVDAAAIQLLRDAASDDSERDAGHAKFFNCRFDSGLMGIQNNGGAGFVEVRNCKFYRLSESGGAGIKCTSTAVAVPLNWIIEGCYFHNNASHILSSMSYSTIKNNTFGRFTATLSIDIDDQPSANQGEYNVITNNYLSGTYGATAYPPGSNNEWGGNWNSLSGGVTAADPA